MKEDIVYFCNYELFLNSIKKKPLVLFVGAGINYPIAPTWSELLDRIIEDALNMKLSLYPLNIKSKKNILHWHKADTMSLYEKATLIKDILKTQYIDHVRNILYPILNDQVPSEFFRSITELCRCSKVKGVVSYNYDDYLLAEVGYKRPVYISQDEDWIISRGYNHVLNCNNKEDALPFYFVHGFIPRVVNSVITEQTGIVLSYDEYFSNMLNPYSWQTVTQIHFLRNYTCLFLGTSLTDWNMLRMIESAKDGRNSVFALMSDQSIIQDKVKFALTDQEAQFIVSSKSSILECCGVKLINSGRTYDSLPVMIKSIIKSI